MGAPAVLHRKTGGACYNGQVDCVLTLDVGSSSARTLAFSFDGRQIGGVGSQIPYRAHITTDGGWEIDPAEITRIAARAIGEACEHIRARRITPVAVAV